ncbi:MAG: hypothetical protein ABIK12_09880, partial [Pseudomonadota bacterium]
MASNTMQSRPVNRGTLALEDQTLPEAFHIQAHERKESLFQKGSQGRSRAGASSGGPRLQHQVQLLRPQV